MSGGPRSSPLLEHHQMAEAASSNTGARRMTEECETAKSRLLDQKFNIKNYHDPLLPRRPNTTKPNPEGVTPEVERRWLKMISDSRQ